MASKIVDIYNLNNFQYVRDTYRIRFIIKNKKLNMIYINDIIINNIENNKWYDHTDKYINIDMAKCFQQLNIDIDVTYNIKYIQKNYSGYIEIETLGKRTYPIYNGTNIFDCILEFYISFFRNIPDSELILLLCKTNNSYKNIYSERFRSIEYSLYDGIGSIPLFKKYYEIYMIVDSRQRICKEKILNKSSNEIVKSFSYYLPIRFEEDSASGDLLVDIYNIYPYINIVFRKLLYGHESISLVQTIKCSCKKVKSITDSFNKAINSCECFIKENIKRLKPIRINIKELEKLFKLLKINPYLFKVECKYFDD